jgi:Flp pilus assembly pilin Flp
MIRLKKDAVRSFLLDTAGAGLVEYAVALIVVTIVGGVIFAFGANVAAIINLSAGAF